MSTVVLDTNYEYEHVELGWGRNGGTSIEVNDRLWCRGSKSGDRSKDEGKSSCEEHNCRDKM